jgi:hypothetical protein
MSHVESQLSAQLEGQSTTEKVTAFRRAVSQLSDTERIEVAKGLKAVLPLPSDSMKDRIWLIIICTFAFVMIWSAMVLGVGVFIGSTDAAKQLTRGDTILTVFTTVVGFLAGLFSPSPLGTKDG